MKLIDSHTQPGKRHSPLSSALQIHSTDDVKQKVSEYLKQSRYFEYFSEAILDKFMSLTEYQCLPKGTVLLSQGQTNQEVFIIVNGSVSVEVDGKYIYSLSRKGDIVGEMSVIKNQPSSATIKAEDNLELITISSALLRKSKEEFYHELYHIFYKWFAHILSDKLNRTSQKAKLYEDLNKELQTEIEARKMAEEVLQESFQTIKEQQVQITQELDEARHTQQVLFPETLPTISGAQIVCKYVPMEQIGGDFYDVVELEKDKVGILIADVTGHGISAALLSFMISSVFKNCAPGLDSTEMVLNLTNGFLCGKLPESKFATLLYTIYDATSRELVYTSASHPPGYVIRPQTKELFPLKTEGIMVGCFPNDIANYEEQRFQLQPGDKVFLYTDGIIEVSNTEDNILGDEALESWLIEHGELPIQEILDQLYEHCLEFSNYQGIGDDVTMIGLEVLE